MCTPSGASWSQTGHKESLLPVDKRMLPFLTLEPETEVMDGPVLPAPCATVLLQGCLYEEMGELEGPQQDVGCFWGRGLCWRSLWPVSSKSQVQRESGQGQERGAFFLFFTSPGAPVTPGNSRNQVTGRRSNREITRRPQSILLFSQIS